MRNHAPLNWPATLSLAFGLAALVGLGPAGSIFAIVLGHVGFRHSEHVGVGRVQADWGLLIGYITLAIWVIVVVVLIRNWFVLLEWQQRLLG